MYFFSSVVVVVFSYLLFRKAAGTLSLSRPNLISWIFYFELIAQTFIASLLVVYGIDEHYMLSGRVADEARFYGWLSVQYCMIVMPLTMNIVRLFFRQSNNVKKFVSYCEADLCFSGEKRDKFYKQSLLLLSMISMLSVFYTYWHIDINPFVALFSLDSEELARVRILNGREFSGISHFKNLFGLLLAPILSYVAFGYYKKTGGLVDKLWFLALFFSSIAILFYDLSKAPIIKYLISFVFISVLFGNKIKFSKQIFYFLSTILALLFLYSFFSRTDNLMSLFFNYNSGVWGRIFLSQAAGTYLAFEYFPDVLSFVGFDSLSTFIGSDVERSARQIMEVINPRGIENGTAGVANSLFVAEAWANFGLFGVFFSPVIVGAYIQLIYQILITGKKTPIKVALYAYFVFHIPVTGGFNDFFYNPSLVFIILMFGGLSILRRGIS